MVACLIVIVSTPNPVAWNAFVTGLAILVLKTIAQSTARVGYGSSFPNSPSLSAFDLDVAFDDAILAFDAAAFGDPSLGDQLDLFLGSVTGVTPGTGVVNLLELSFDLPSDLNALQAASFTLATLTFTAQAISTSTLDLSVNALADAFGDPLTLDTVFEHPLVVVPEPKPVILLAFAMTLTLALRLWRLRARPRL